MDVNNHPCFNDKIRQQYARIHLPVASRCNIQCRFCNRKFDCVNESRPGVTSALLSPDQAIGYLKEVVALKPNISVVGIAGPGDPFANADETMETLSLVRENFPEIMLCVASNGLNVLPYVDRLKQVNVSHVTITVNAIDIAVASQIYAWIRVGKRVVSGENGVKTLLGNQIAAIKALKQAGVTVKVNSIIIPGINDHHIEAVAERMKELKVDILNCVAYYPNEGAIFKDIEEPSPEMIKDIRKKAGKHIRQMHHCTRCRADAVGLLGEKTDEALMQKLMSWNTTEKKGTPLSIVPKKIAVASMEGMLINQHLGEAASLYIYGKHGDKIALLETRSTPDRGSGIRRWQNLSDSLKDCDTLLVSGIGQNPLAVLSENGMRVYEMEGMIHDAVNAIFNGQPINHMIKRDMTACGAGCQGNGNGCG
ncbi:MAG: radical SAM protein [Proteobacteria bacterium]|nr:radical SAM protein [Pseudomonadota bacterium]